MNTHPSVTQSFNTKLSVTQTMNVKPSNTKTPNTQSSNSTSVQTNKPQPMNSKSALTQSVNTESSFLVDIQTRNTQPMTTQPIIVQPMNTWPSYPDVTQPINTQPINAKPSYTGNEQTMPTQSCYSSDMQLMNTQSMNIQSDYVRNYQPVNILHSHPIYTENTFQSSLAVNAAPDTSKPVDILSARYTKDSPAGHAALYNENQYTVVPFKPSLVPTANPIHGSQHQIISKFSSLHDMHESMNESNAINNNSCMSSNNGHQSSYTEMISTSLDLAENAESLGCLRSSTPNALSNSFSSISSDSSVSHDPAFISNISSRSQDCSDCVIKDIEIAQLKQRILELSGKSAMESILHVLTA